MPAPGRVQRRRGVLILRDVARFPRQSESPFVRGLAGMRGDSSSSRTFGGLPGAVELSEVGDYFLAAPQLRPPAPSGQGGDLFLGPLRRSPPGPLRTFGLRLDCSFARVVRRPPLRPPVRPPLSSSPALAEGGVFASVPPFAGFAFCRHIYVATSSVHEFDAISISHVLFAAHPSTPAIASALATQRFLGRTAGIDRRRLVRRGCLAAGGLPGDGA